MDTTTIIIIGLIVLAIGIGVLVYILTRKKKETKIIEGPPGDYEKDMKLIKKDDHDWNVDPEKSELEGVLETVEELEQFDDGFDDNFENDLDPYDL